MKRHIIGILLCMLAGVGIGFALDDWRWSKRCLIQNMQLEAVVITGGEGCLIRGNTIGKNHQITIDPGWRLLPHSIPTAPGTDI